jgi:hypothetical protein
MADDINREMTFIKRKAKPPSVFRMDTVNPTPADYLNNPDIKYPVLMLPDSRRFSDIQINNF